VPSECDIDMAYVTWARTFLAALALAGCAASSAGRPPESAVSAVEAAPPQGAIARLTQASEEQQKHIAELEARLALLESEARDARERYAVASKPAETVRIGGRRREPEPDPIAESSSIPVVRLHESAPQPMDPVSLPAAPDGVDAKLGVVPLPGERAAKAIGNAQPIAVSPRDRYRVALGLVRERRWDEAERALTELLAQHPPEELSSGATYWRGEVYYAQRRYREALGEFEAVLSRAASGKKAADSLLKVGLCHSHLGDQSTAQRYFRQVIEQYPTSDAARIASREGSS
jgi:tol-pal system protein YbgF